MISSQLQNLCYFCICSLQYKLALAIAIMTGPAPFPETPLPQKRPATSPATKTTANADQDRLCWVHRKSPVTQKSYLWPARYYAHWAQACQEISPTLSNKDNKTLCLRVYKKFLGTKESTMVAHLFGKEPLEFVEIPQDDDTVLFGAFFGGYFAQAMQEQATSPSCFAGDDAWYLDFLQAFDQAMKSNDPEADSQTRSLYEMGKTCLQEMEENGTTNKIAVAAVTATPPAKNTAAETTQPTLKATPHHGSSSVSPSSLEESIHETDETPTHSNKNTKKMSPLEQRELFAPSTKKRSLPRVTPSRSSGRARRQATLKTDSLMPTPSTTKASMQKFDEFYHFKNLIDVLQRELGWIYRTASNQLYTYVYERTEGAEKNGVLLQDFFYEEHQVIDYCVANEYKKKYGSNSMVTPSPQKKARRHATRA